ncbi:MULTISPECIES: L-fuculose-phosphate aldolase [unclassified Bradyrhizobium]|uniref:L-fuculose-phosphate aldolase n=1 Tax=Bradyrhizobium TaxID=374 RepID=UPI001CD20225|nr:MULTISPECIES: L-fuculose-phosphate aldolase [unclassified Bradyrhizobium]MCA1376426.1 L-fuculose-phosphate aldolase [Bradyrhizobium sp. IC4060]MCA1487193.1 L-fuculose-phosphate aldolase [Bradyrhizobium sp. IC4061]MCA1542986.1 L-fuculose-phosphate aldolase [Bradyrhizobium sp. NBAIM32]
MTGREAELELRQSIIDACREMAAQGINQGTSGNISVRTDDGILLTPSGLPYDRMKPEDIVAMKWDGSWTASAGNVPSTEWRFHLDILKSKPEVGAVVHAHPVFCTIIAIMNRSIPAIHYMIAAAGGNDIPCAPYAQYGTAELSQAALNALRYRRACLLAHHGLIAIGPNLRKALWLAVEVEVLAKQYHGCLQLGSPPLLPDEEIDSILKRWGHYGLRDNEGAPKITQLSS